MDGPSRKSKAEGVDATNRDFIRYDQVEKRQSYRLADTMQQLEALYDRVSNGAGPAGRSV